MKAILTADVQDTNPAYSGDAKRAASRSGQKYDVEPLISIPAGTELEDENCWMLCVLDKAEPADDACRAKVAQYFGNDTLKQMLGQVLKLQASAKTRALTTLTQKWVDAKEKAWSKQLAELRGGGQSVQKETNDDAADETAEENG